MNKRVLITEKRTGIIYNIMIPQIKLLGIIPSRYTNLKDLKNARTHK